MLYGLASLPDFLGPGFFNRYNVVEQYDISDSTDKMTRSNDIIVYPNPTKDKIIIETSLKIGHSFLSIHNIDGKELIHYQLNDCTTELDISDLKKGVYFLKILNDKTIFTKKIIKE
jgi:hypothetical protein